MRGWYRRAVRQVSVSAVPSGPSIDIWRSCKCPGSLIRALSGLPGGLGRFVPCRIGAHHCRLRSIGWEQCGHGLTPRPSEVAHAGFLDHLLVLFGYPESSGCAQDALLFIPFFLGRSPLGAYLVLARLVLFSLLGS